MSPRPRQAMVLAAGFGRRLRPLSAVFPKPAMRMMGRPLLSILLRRLARAGVERVVVNVHHRPERLAACLDGVPEGVELHVSREERLLGTAGGLARVQDQLEGGRFFLLNGDTLADVDLSDVADAHEKAGAVATLVLRPRPGGSAYSSVLLDGDARIRNVGGDVETGDRDLMFAGVWLLEPEVLGWLSGEPAGLERELLPRLVESRTALGYVFPGAFVTIDTPRRYWQACLTMAREGDFREDWAVARIEGKGPGVVFAGAGVSIEDGASFEGHVILGAGTRIGRNARLANVVCWEDVVVGPDVRLENAVVTTGARLSEDASMSERVVMRAENDASEVRRRDKNGRLVVSDLRPMPAREL